MAIVDILGREVKVGDIVVSTNNSSSYKQIHVVTRLGSADRIQVNGNSYLKAEYTMICTEQYSIAKGQEACESLINENKEFFVEQQVEKKPPSPKFYVLCMNRYKTPGVVNTKPRYFVVALRGNGHEMVVQYQDFFKDIDLSAFGQYFSTESLNKNNKWYRSSMGHLKTMKELKAIGLENVINSEITEGSAEYQILENFR